jgi:predicted nucleotidyltransferase
LRKTLAELREGCLIESVEDVIFDVKGLVHPPDKVIAFPRFIPDKKGSRIRNGVRYGKVYGISERFAFLEKAIPKYVVHDPVFDERLCEVPLENVKKVYSPVEGLKRLKRSENLDGLEGAALQCLKILREKAKVPWNCLGVSGSLLVGLHTEKSDIDPVIYGVENCRKVHSALQELLEECDTPFRRYSLKDLRVLFDFRSKDTAMSFEDFVAIESRKVFQGRFLGRDYFIRFVKAPGEVDEKYGEIHYSNVGYGKIEAVVVDDSEAIFTPCKYKIEDVKVVEGPRLKPIMEIVSFRGRFCEQARKDERVIAQGKIEHVKDYRKGEEYYRLLIGNNPADHMILKIGKVKP